jgi:hypothetical protein
MKRHGSSFMDPPDREVGDSGFLDFPSEKLRAKTLVRISRIGSLIEKMKRNASISMLL